MAGVSREVHDDLSELLPRIADSAERLRDLNTQLRVELALRDKLIVEAYDHAGLKQRAIADAAGITVPSITRILSRSSAD